MWFWTKVVHQFKTVIPSYSGVVGRIITYENLSYSVNTSLGEFCKNIATPIGTPPAQLTIV